MINIDTSQGTLGVGSDGSFHIQFVRDLPQSPERAWSWLTEPDKLERWLPGCHIEARQGGAVCFDFGDEGTATGEVVGINIPDGTNSGLIEHTWVWEGVPTSTVTWMLESHGGGTRLTLRHRELVEQPAREFTIGWHMMLDSLQLDLQGSPTGPAWETGERLASLYLTP